MNGMNGKMLILEPAPIVMSLLKFHHINYYVMIKSTRDTFLENQNMLCELIVR